MTKHGTAHFMEDVGDGLIPKAGLLDLPPEIRLLIYHQLLLEGSSTRIQLRAVNPPVLFSICKLIRKEALPVFFSHSRFVLTLAIPPPIYDSSDSGPRIHRISIPQWIQALETFHGIQALETFHDIHMRNVKVEIDYGFRWVVVAMAPWAGGKLQIVEAWLHNGRQKLPITQIRERVAAFLDEATESRLSGAGETVGLSYRDVVLIAGKMCQQWAGTIIPADRDRS